MVADDVAANCDLLSRLLREMGAEVTVVEDGDQALRELNIRRHDIAFLDIQMPGLTGFQVAQQVLAKPGAGRAKLVAISASVLKHEQNLYEEVGFDDFVSKPFRLEHICECLERVLGVTFEGEVMAGEAGQEHEPGGTDRPVRPTGAGVGEGSAVGANFDPGLAERRPLRILLADDYELNQKLVARILREFGDRCDFAAPPSESPINWGRLQEMLGEDPGTVRDFLGKSQSHLLGDEAQSRCFPSVAPDGASIAPSKGKVRQEQPGGRSARPSGWARTAPGRSFGPAIPVFDAACVSETGCSAT